MYLTSERRNIQGHEDDALTLLTSIVGKNSVGRLYKKLVVEDKMAASASAAYSGMQLDSGVLNLSAVGFGRRSAGAGSRRPSTRSLLTCGPTALLKRSSNRRARSHWLGLVYEADDVAEVAQSYGSMLDYQD